ncbi:Uma2 family endonuclease [Lentzea albida]|uniref:Endonuclease, Uma2 family (Restriction endonuclease fold) n=1 Tax=Lentzea albida TaxID=65499 RepID=A0A1H9LG26_9PSEU|nr:Uma2 family endonuclease [Lentzea albida]SER10199.1 Endonuclease, Uma2 family (restriction endonuclease fold) [Lentzea albida]
MAAPAETAPAQYLLPRHAGPWSLDDVLSLPEDNSQRIELVDGMLLVSPLGSYRHQQLVARAFRCLVGACPVAFEATIELNVLLSSGRLVIPDFTIVRPREAGILFPVSDVVLVGEVFSPSTRLNDQGLKRDLYAQAGIEYYLMVDPEPRVVEATLLELQDGEYVEIAVSKGGVLETEQPFPVTITF